MQQFQTFLSFLVLQHVFADVSEEEGIQFSWKAAQKSELAEKELWMLFAYFSTCCNLHFPNLSTGRWKDWK